MAFTIIISVHSVKGIAVVTAVCIGLVVTVTVSITSVRKC